MLTVNHISVFAQHDLSRALVKDIYCTFEKGTVTLLIGQTGSGKTTLLHAMAGLLRLGKGSISYGELPLWEGERINQKAVRQVGVTFQYPERQLFAETVLKEFAYSLKPFRLSKTEKLRRMHEALTDMKLHENLLQESVLTLSDGQKRKIALATTLAAQPEWLLLDEPTAGIDPQGIAPLLQAISRHKQNASGGGIIIASHDLDTFLPIADRVIVLRHGEAVADMTPDELCAKPGLLLQTRIGLPASVQIIRELQKNGLHCSPGASLAPDDMADAIIAQINAHGIREMKRDEDSSIMIAEEVPDGHRDYPAAPSGDSDANIRYITSLIRSLHPVAKWLFYLFASAGILLQDHGAGVLFSAIIAAVCAVSSGVALRSLVKQTKPFLHFIWISFLLSGLILSLQGGSLGVESISFSWANAVHTVRQLLLIYFVMVLGMVLARTTSSGMMQQGLLQALAFLKRFKVPVELFTFVASLLLRFIPMLIKEMDRMSLIVKARGKAYVRTGFIRLRDVPVFLIPLILVMMKNAEDYALALEARGFTLKNPGQFGSAPHKKFERKDFVTVTIGGVLLIVFIVVDIWLT